MIFAVPDNLLKLIVINLENQPYKDVAGILQGIGQCNEVKIRKPRKRTKDNVPKDKTKNPEQFSEKTTEKGK